MLNRPELATNAIRARPEILEGKRRSIVLLWSFILDLFVSCQDMFTKIYVQSPSLLHNVCLANPAIAASLFQRDDRLLLNTIVLCPEVLTKVLKATPTVFRDVAVHCPELVEDLLLSNPELTLVWHGYASR